MVDNRFIAIDVETANPWFGSICQIGAVEFSGGEITNEWQSLVNPDCEFHDFHVRLHKITPDLVVGAPPIGSAIERLRSIVGDDLIASYGPFDRSAVSQACTQNSVPGLPNPWLNIHQVVKRAWPERYSAGGYRLTSVCKFLGVPLPRHHNAIDDARAAGMVLVRACEATGLSSSEWLARNRRPVLAPHRPASEAIEVNQDGPLTGEVIVFTGALQMPRRQAQEAAAALGCQPANGVTKKTTILVVGDQDLTRTLGKEKSSKHQKAEALIEAGADIRIIGESDFLSMITIDSPTHE